MEPLELCDALIKGTRIYYKNQKCVVIGFTNECITILILTEVGEAEIVNKKIIRAEFSTKMESAWDDLPPIPENSATNSGRVQDLERWLSKYKKQIQEIPKI